MSTSHTIQSQNDFDPWRSQLAPLREQMANICRRRRVIRLAAAVLAIGIALVSVLVVIFLLDWQFSMSRLQRIVALFLGAGATAWAYRKYAAPLSAIRETDLDIALLIEKEQQIDSDLVAALQFETPEAAQWGSKQLERAVISYVAEFSRDSQLLERSPHRTVARRGTVVAVALLAIIAAAVWQPRYAATFFNRLAMSSRHYPTRTSIDQIVINAIEITKPGQVVRCGFGQPVEFRVRISGDSPGQVHKIDFLGVKAGEQRSIELSFVQQGNSNMKAASNESSLHAELPGLVDSLQCRVLAGDAWSEPARLEVIPLPIIEPQITVTPPQYARQSTAADVAIGSWQISVLKGSQVEAGIKCRNKQLTAANLTIGTQTFPLIPRDSTGQNWALPAPGTPLEKIGHSLEYKIEATDSDGLHLPRPIAGSIAIKADSPPAITAAANVRLFVPSGLPEIRYTVDDEFGISAVRAIVEIDHKGSESPSLAQQTFEVLTMPRDKPLVRPNLPISGIFRLPLTTLKGVKGDEVKITLETTSFRGDEPGTTVKSDPITLQITDEAGIMAALGEADKQAAQKMDALIERQSEVGGSK